MSNFHTFQKHKTILPRWHLPQGTTSIAVGLEFEEAVIHMKRCCSNCYQRKGNKFFSMIYLYATLRFKANPSPVVTFNVDFKWQQDPNIVRAGQGLGGWGGGGNRNVIRTELVMETIGAIHFLKFGKD